MYQLTRNGHLVRLGRVLLPHPTWVVAYPRGRGGHGADEKGQHARIIIGRPWALGVVVGARVTIGSAERYDEENVLRTQKKM